MEAAFEIQTDNLIHFVLFHHFWKKINFLKNFCNLKKIIKTQKCVSIKHKVKNT